MNVATLAAGIPWDFETFPEYLDSVRRRGSVLNFAVYVGHTAVRLFVMGDDAYHRAAKAEEIERMAEVVTEAMEAGAAGFASSFAATHRGADGLPVPSRLAEHGELDALLAAVSAVGRGIFAVVPGGYCTIDHLYELQPALGLPITYGALLTSTTGNHNRLVDLNRNGWEHGVEVWPQVSPRPLTFQFGMAAPFTLNVNNVFAELMASGLEARRAAYADPAWRQRVMEAFESQSVLVPNWAAYEIDESTSHPELVGRPLSELAAEQGTTPLDLLLDATLDEPDLGLRARGLLANGDREAVGRLLQEEHCTLGLSDAGAHVGQLCDAPQATDFLGNWVRERGIMPIEQAVRMLTGQQADLFAFPDRGYLRPGAWADVVVFDPDTVAPGPVRRVRDFPADAERLTADAPEGITHVLVNGTPIRADGQIEQAGLAALPGQIASPGPRP